MGRLLSSTDEATDEVTAYDYCYPGCLTSNCSPWGISPVSGHSTIVRRFAGTASETRELTEYDADNRVTRTAHYDYSTSAWVTDKTYEYSVGQVTVNNESFTAQWTKVYTGPQGVNSLAWVRTWTDPLGRTVREDRPAYETTPSGAFVSTLSIYNSKGQLARTEHRLNGTGDKFLADTVYEYDDLGNQVRSGLDLGTAGLQNASTDRIQESDTYYEQDAGNWWQVSTGKVYAKDGDATATPTGTQKRRLTGFAAGVIEESVSIDMYGNQTVSRTEIEQLGDGSKLVKQIVDVPDSQYNQMSVSRNGLAQYTISTSNLKTKYGHDALGRRTSVKEQRHTGSTVTAYNSTTGRVDTVTDPAGNVTSYAYHPNTGRLTSVTRTVDSQSIVQYFAYDAQGRQTHVWGSGTYPVQYGYDDYGRRTTMKTYRGGTEWNSETLPAAFGGDADVTTWAYDPASGLLTSKTDDSNKSVVYTYTPDGRLSTRQWARDGANTVTTYNYDSHTGEMTEVDYPGSDTPDVTFSYTRLGQKYQITDGVGTRTFDYDDDDTEVPITNRLHAVSEHIVGSGDFAGLDKTLYRKYQGTGPYEVPGRDGGFYIGPWETREYDVWYSYDPSTGRFSGIGGPGVNSVYYGRVADSDLIGGRYYNWQLYSGPAVVSQQYEDNRDLIKEIYNTANSTVRSHYEYVNDALGRRTSVETSGEAFNSQTAFNSWGYNPKSELTSSRRYTGEYDPTPDPQDEVLAEKRLYGYDHIGNRLESTEGTASATTYGANDVNAYDWVQRPSPDPQEYFCYDDDGNLKLDGKTLSTCPGTDGLREFKWDAENRLIEVVPVSPSNDPPRNKKVKFVYDYMGRRVQKAVYMYSNGWPADNNPTEVQRFVYNGWNPVLVLDANNVTKRKYTWGLDLSGKIHGAGGIGGLLACEEPQTTGGPKKYWFMYDANGNVGQVLDATNTSSITIAAHYEYDAYGNVINNLSSYTYATANPFRFSTKWFDAETGLGYWGYRYYSPRLGRWISRDPVGERGGLNLYEYVRGMPTFQIDPHGTETASEEARRWLRTSESKHSNSIYYRLAGVDHLYGQLSWALANIRVGYYILSGLGANAAEYSWVWNTLTILHNDSVGPEVTIVHELVHALDDLNDWHIGPWLQDFEAAEALAYGTADHLLVAALRFADIEAAKVKKCKDARMHWAAAWRALNSVSSQSIAWPGGPKRGRPLTYNDLWDVNAKLGVRFSCSKLKPAYEEMLAERGVFDWDEPIDPKDRFNGLPCRCTLPCSFGHFTLDAVFR